MVLTDETLVRNLYLAGHRFLQFPAALNQQLGVAAAPTLADHCDFRGPQLPERLKVMFD
jgi:hypothetical protein